MLISSFYLLVHTRTGSHSDTFLLKPDKTLQTDKSKCAAQLGLCPHRDSEHKVPTYILKHQRVTGKHRRCRLFLADRQCPTWQTDTRMLCAVASEIHAQFEHCTGPKLLRRVTRSAGKGRASLTKTRPRVIKSALEVSMIQTSLDPQLKGWYRHADVAGLSPAPPRNIQLYCTSTCR